MIAKKKKEGGRAPCAPYLLPESASAASSKLFKCNQIEDMITSLIEMLELSNFVHVTTSTENLSRVVLLLASFTEIVML